MLWRNDVPLDQDVVDAIHRALPDRAGMHQADWLIAATRALRAAGIVARLVTMPQE